ncbi:unnamed protein product [Effrenium voratum]|uniref:MORN repeat-containing protein n=1 Tax=Effrenium voratum TaxID=2562239 RepID=A0AA36IW17_9DINO|nr:unnamed protein product [Effrenium voratum]CAJ1444722.1 unnamed protein product [Effrenium voratum]
MVFGALPHIDWQYQKELEEKHGKALAEGSCGPGLWSLRRCVPSGEEVSKCTVRAFEATEETFTCHRSVAREEEVRPEELASLTLEPLSKGAAAWGSAKVNPRLVEKQQAWVGSTVIALADKVERRWADGRLYVGDWCESGWPDGRGELKHPDGWHLRGQWCDGKLHGEGEYWSKSGHSYSGHWSQGHQEGEGVETWPDGTRFQGTFRAGSISKGILRLPSGLVRRVL